MSGKCGPVAATAGSQSVAAAAESMVTKSLDNIVGSLWQARQESSGSSMGNQVRLKEIEKQTDKRVTPEFVSALGIGDCRLRAVSL